MNMYKAVIIDDEPWTRDVIKGLGKWQELNIAVLGEASDGEYGREIVKLLEPDIIITDVRMPHLNGIDLVAQLRREGNTSKIIVISGYDDLEYIHSVLKLDVIDYLLKPIKPEELNGQLARAVEMLKKETRIRSGESIDISLHAPWTKEYFALRSRAYESLRAYNEKDIEQVFNHLKVLFQNNQQYVISKSTMIGLYYGLMEWLQKFIDLSGYANEDLIHSEECSFVFSGETRISDMLDNVCNLYCSVSGRVLKLIHERNRLNIHQVEEYIKSSYFENGNVTLEDTAARFFVSREYLSKIFKQATGEGFSEYVAALRMAKAKELIARGVEIKDVGSMTGYMDQAHFYKSFKRFYGITPGEMKKQIKN